MKKILILGAGLSSSSLIKYLLDTSDEFNLKITVTALDIKDAQKKIGGHPNAVALEFDTAHIKKLPELIADCDVAVSLLPAKYHPIVARECLRQKKHMFTTSYVSPTMQKLSKQVREAGLLFLNECGVDPGIDHMSAMKIIDEIRSKGGKLINFESNTGGLVAPEFDNNPWHYKFTWNARNVILAGQAGARFLHNGKVKYIPYQQLFSRTEIVQVLDYGDFEVYANRDSFLYKDIYGLDGIQTLFRGTMRRPGYSDAFDCFIKIGLTDDNLILENSEELTNRSFVDSFLPENPELSVEENLCRYLGITQESNEFQKMQWLGLFEDEPIKLKRASAAKILQSVIEKKWQLAEQELDMVVMQHQFIYELGGKKFERKSSLVVIGKDRTHTAMAITVGTPLAIAIKLFLTGEIKASGVVIPVKPEVYNPILDELEQYGVKFIDEEKEII
ncbi:MAG: saccharopine dehydrogenase NADP-binding domain-containing protein [Candidatus Kapabacteria bacterium]|nr:saccharopine dehydrogenase NADP-binding domain-containing protein [Ignavibacteriota bacterium]MCW5883515.1 saccharopine dehydrogenase NADP-binding domain-containing protein [Candidatus Kapabacteria bacterium]